MDIKTAEKVVTECRQTRERIQEAMASVEAQGQEAERRLADLRKDLPMTLASQALGEVTQGEVDETITEIAELERVIETLPLTLKGLRIREEQAMAEMAKAQKTVTRHKAEKRYAEVKAQLEVKYSKDLDGYLRQAAKEIGYEKQAEAEDFLRRAKKKWEETSLQDRV